ncbi:unnamed protein product [Rotaria magnacalcarata]|uniref:Uncharacterized protein n=2 Tax=Rotaria magnacalcarata TaxID=392030 RepID=A0A816H8L2_9BILA|nr:unnamed protein product [Rotaria magnacalcarata]CAF4379075.1 unnamed protein product [Rotaria magnacalcarata]
MDKSVFSVFGPNLGHYADNIIIVFKREISPHPDANFSIQAATSFVSENAFVLRPWLGHLPQLVPLSYIDHVYIPKKLYESFSNNTRKAINANFKRNCTIVPFDGEANQPREPHGPIPKSKFRAGYQDFFIKELFKQHAEHREHSLSRAVRAKWCWQNDDGEKINDENHTQQIEVTFPHCLKSSTTSTLVLPVDNLKSGTIVNYNIHFLPTLKTLLTSNTSSIDGRLVCGYQMRENTSFKKEIIRYPIVSKIQSTPVVYSPKPLNKYISKMREILQITNQQQIQLDFQRESSEQLSMILKGLKANVLEAKLKIALYPQDILKMKVDNDDELRMPKELDDQKEECKLVEINRNDPSFTRIENRMKEALNSVKIDKIERVKNIRMWNHYAFRRRELKKELCSSTSKEIEMELFRGTKTTLASEVYNGEWVWV